MNTQISAICHSLLRGETLDIFKGMKWFGVSNLPREIGRSVERKFGVTVDKKMVTFKTRYGTPGYYYEYRLIRNKENKTGIMKMAEYVSKHSSEMVVRKKNIKGFKQVKLFA
jgi:hypothetical protein